MFRTTAVLWYKVARNFTGPIGGTVTCSTSITEGAPLLYSVNGAVGAPLPTEGSDESSHKNVKVTR